MNPIHILHLISSSGLLGAERVLLEIAESSRRAGLEVGIGIFQNNQNPNSELAEAAMARGFEVKVFSCNGRFDKNTLQMVKDYLNRKPIRVVHSHNYKSNFYARMALSGKGVRWVVTNHGRRFGVKLSVYNLLDTFIVRRADQIIAVSEGIAGRLNLAGIDKKKIQVIENGIHMSRVSAKMPSNAVKESIGLRPGAILIGSIGSLTKEKGHAYLLKAAPQVIERFPEVVLLIVGNGREYASLESIASRLRITEKIIFAGMRKDIPEILSILDVFVLPSLNEGLPMALLEAQAARVPTVATRAGAVPNVIQDGVTGILIPSKDIGSIAQAICRILSDKKLALEMAEKGYERVRDHFSSEQMAAKYLAIYRALLS